MDPMTVHDFEWVNQVSPEKRKEQRKVEMQRCAVWLVMVVFCLVFWMGVIFEVGRLVGWW